jgi:arylsulfatase A-like enzyme
MGKALLDRRWPWLLSAAVLLLILLYSIRDAQQMADPRPVGSADDLARLRDRDDLNILFILLDTLRADRLGSYGYARDTSPNLDGFASTGVRFGRHLSQSSWTKASMASLWTGILPTRTGITRFDDVIPAEADLPAEILKRAGFLTAGIYRNGWVAPTFGFEQGFDAYTRPPPRRHRAALKMANPTIKNRGTDEDAVATALEFLRVNGDDRWFVYLHLMDVHEYVYDEESALFGGSYSDIYDNAIRWQDGVIGVLMAHLADQGLTQSTRVVVASDHGEAFRARGGEGHARTVYRETTEVPFFLFPPFRLDPGVVVETRSQNIDIWPTIFDLVGIEAPAGADGRSLVPDILAAARGEAPPPAARTAVSHLDMHWGQRDREPRPTIAVADGTLRYVRMEQGKERREELFDAASDPGELKDLSAEDPDALERLRSVADAHLESVPPWEAGKREIDELELNQLRALGYALP